MKNVYTYRRSAAWLLFALGSLFVIPLVAAPTETPSATAALRVKTYDGLELPAQVIVPNRSAKGLLLFINGSTPYDEKGYLGASVGPDGKLLREPHDFYMRFLNVMPSKGYAVATMAKRSFVYPNRRPRPSLDDFALDIQSFIAELKIRSLLKDETELTIVGYSEGSEVAAKALGLLKRQPAGCVLLGSASVAYNYSTGTWDQWPYLEAYRRVHKLSDESIEKRFNLQKKLSNEILEIDEDIFENEWKKNGSLGIAPWESFHVDREIQFFDPVPGLLKANVPVLIALGERDTAMPLALAERTYRRLQDGGFKKVALKLIEDDLHQYEKYDVFLIIDAWIGSGGRTTEFTPGSEDKRAMEGAMQISAIRQAISQLPWRGAAITALEAFRSAKEGGLPDPSLWFKLGLVLFGGGSYEESLAAFRRTVALGHPLPHGPMAWIGHIYDLQKNRAEALKWYSEALKRYNGIPLRHDNYGIVLDKNWLEARLKQPFAGVNATARP